MLRKIAERLKMRIAVDQIDITCPEAEIYNRLLQLDDAHILELGCGSAQLTRDIASAGSNRRITALEVDEIAHGINLQITDLPNVSFALAGAEAIPLVDASVDVVLMFKSLHHVPMELMATAMQEIRRVLKPGGLAYISEPIFAGAFNDILRLFHDERQVREAAFNAVSRAVDDEVFELADEIFFNSPMQFDSFTDFEDRILKATHTQHNLSDDVYALVRERFESHVDDDGARFLMPIRVDLLRRPA
jgi:ubiquinone/menaquinone biosynthesis C-methylase UbiE